MTGDDRDYAEENYNRDYCDACDSSPCRADNGHCQCGEYELDSDGCCNGCGYLEIECMCAPHPIPHPPTWPGYIDNRYYNTDYFGAFPNGEE